MSLHAALQSRDKNVLRQVKQIADLREADAASELVRLSFAAVAKAAEAKCWRDETKPKASNSMKTPHRARLAGARSRGMPDRILEAERPPHQDYPKMNETPRKPVNSPTLRNMSDDFPIQMPDRLPVHIEPCPTSRPFRNAIRQPPAVGHHARPALRADPGEIPEQKDLPVAQLPEEVRRQDPALLILPLVQFLSDASSSSSAPV